MLDLRTCPVRSFGVALVCFLLFAPVVSQAADISKEYEIKAVFLFNFAQFITWPADAFASDTEPFRIGILGDDPFSSFLDQTVQGEKVGNHPLLVERCTSLDDAQKCQILFISRSERTRLGAILERLSGHNILTVGDMPDFARNRGVIGFTTEANKIRFQINLEEAKKADLVISSKMLRLAELFDKGDAP